jgi:hypothetical protein
LIALVASLLSIWFRISTALSEIVVGTIAQLIIGGAVGSAILGTEESWIKFLSGIGAIILTFLAGAELDPVVFKLKWKEAGAVGLASFLLPFLACAAAARYLLGWEVMRSWLAGGQRRVHDIGAVGSGLLRRVIRLRQHRHRGWANSRGSGARAKHPYAIDTKMLRNKAANEFCLSGIIRSNRQRLPMRIQIVVTAGLLAAGSALAQVAPVPSAPHNVVIFVADGLRSRMVNDQTARNMAALAREGVYLVNSHSLFPTFTTANASAIATGHYLGDTGDFSNTIYTGFQVPSVSMSLTPFIENNSVLADLDGHFGGKFSQRRHYSQARARQGL